MLEDTDQPQPASAPDSDAPPEQPAAPTLNLQPGQGAFHLETKPESEQHGMTVAIVPLVATIKAEPEMMDRIAAEWIRSRPALFAALIHEKVEEARAAQSAIIVPDGKTIRAINSKQKRHA